ncbi:MAG: tetratricopeptide repeat protein [Planctomycetota bacterium]
MLRPLLVLGVMAVAALPAGAQSRIDVLNRERKLTTITNVVIAEESLDKVKVLRAGRETSYDTIDVVLIDYGPGSPAWEQARSAAAANDWVNAENLFAAAARDTTPPWVAAQALLAQADAASRRGSSGLTAAQTAIAEFLKRHANHRLLPQALLAKARFAARAGDKPAAQEATASVLDLARQGKITADWTARTHLLLGELRLGEKDTRGATEAYTAAESAVNAARPAVTARPDLADELDSLALEARVGSASCLLANGDVAGARSYYQRLAADGKTNPAVAAAAANGLAECDFREPAKLKQAQLGFARVALTATAFPTERARALYFLGKCAETLGQQNLEPDARVRAMAYWQECAQLYPETSWARLARESLP